MSIVRNLLTNVSAEGARGGNHRCYKHLSPDGLNPVFIPTGISENQSKSGSDVTEIFLCDLVDRCCRTGKADPRKSRESTRNCTKRKQSAIEFAPPELMQL